MKYTRRALSSLGPEPMLFAGECPIEPRTWERPYALPQDDSSEKLSLVMPAQTKWYEKEVRTWLKRHYGWAIPMTGADGALRLEAEFSMPRSSGRRKTEVYAPVKPDIDNLARAFLESFDFKSFTVEGRRLGVIDQRTPLTTLSLSKRWSESDEWPGTRFSITKDGGNGALFSDYLYSAQTSNGDAKVLSEKAACRRFDELDDAPEWYAQRLDFKPVPWREPILYGKRVGTDSDVQKWQRRARTEIIAGYGLRKPMGGPLIFELDVIYDKLDSRHKNQWLILIDYAKTVMDCLDFRTQTKDKRPLGAVENDSRIVALSASMRKVDEWSQPGMRFAIYPMASGEDGKEDIQMLFDHIETGYNLI